MTFRKATVYNSDIALVRNFSDVLHDPWRITGKVYDNNEAGTRSWSRQGTRDEGVWLVRDGPRWLAIQRSIES